MSTLSAPRIRRNVRVTFRIATPPPEPAREPGLAAELARVADAFRAYDLPAAPLIADRIAAMAKRAEFLGAETAEQFEDRERTLNASVLSVRICPKRTGRYEAWDVVNGNGLVVRSCTDLFDAMMWIRATLTA